MKLLLVPVVVILLYALYALSVRRSKSASRSGNETAALESSKPEGTSVSIWRSQEVPNGESVRLSKRVTLTFIGAGAGTVTEYLAGSISGDPETRIQSASRRSLQLALRMSKHNVECPEVESWRAAVLKQLDEAARKATGQELMTGSQQSEDDDPEDALQDARRDAMAELGGTGFRRN